MVFRNTSASLVRTGVWQRARRRIVLGVASLSALAVVAVPAAQASAAQRPHTTAAGVPVIFDTDIYSSFDDGGAELTLLGGQLMGLDNVIAIGVDTRTDRPAVATDSWKCAAAIAQYYGFPNIPIGSDMPDDGPAPSTGNFIGPCAAYASANTPSPQPVVPLYRQALAAQPDDSVIIVCTGYEENLSNLLDSGPDANSPLDGAQLIAQKVKELVVTGGGYPSSTGENNFEGNAGAANNVAQNWPTKIVYSGYEVGSNVVSGGSVTSVLPSNDPIRAAMLAYAGSNKAIASYDLTTAYHAIEPGDASLTEVGPGTNAIGTYGANTFTLGPGDEYYLELTNTTSLETSLDEFWDLLPGKASQGLSFTSSAPGSVVDNGATYAASAGPGGSGNPVTLTIDPTSTSGCSIDDSGVVTFNQPAGSCVIDANEPGTTYYAPAEAQQSITVGKMPQNVSFTSTAPSSPQIGGTYTPTASGGASGNPVTFTIDSSSTSGCTIGANDLVTFSAPYGTCVIDASQAGNAAYASGAQQQTIGVGGDPQTLTFTSRPPAPTRVGGSPYTPVASSSAGLTVTLSLDKSSSGCTDVGGVVRFVAVGRCLIDAGQAGNSSTLPASAQQSITIGRGATVITVLSAAPTHALVGQSYGPRARSTSGDAVRLILGSASTGCAVQGNRVVFRSAGTCVLRFIDNGNANWAPATPARQSFRIAAATRAGTKGGRAH